MKKNNQVVFQGTVFLIIATFSHGLYGIFSRLIGQEFGQIYQVVARSSVLLIYFVILTIVQKCWHKIQYEDYKWFLLMIIPGLIALASMFTSFNHLALGTVLFTYYAISTLGSYFLGYLLFKERLNKIKVLSLLLSFFGLYLIFFGSLQPGNILYLLLACLAGLGAATWNIMSKKISDTYPVSQILLIDSLLLVVIGLPISMLLKERISFPTFSIHWFGILGYATAAIGSSVFTIKGFKYLEAQIGSLIMLLEPIFGVIIGFFLYKEILTYYAGIGAIIILIGIALPNIYKQSNSV
jgi:drug/metabolite transporter (DMT)-like permease